MTISSTRVVFAASIALFSAASGCGGGGSDALLGGGSGGASGSAGAGGSDGASGNNAVGGKSGASGNSGASGSNAAGGKNGVGGSIGVGGTGGSGGIGVGGGNQAGAGGVGGAHGGSGGDAAGAAQSSGGEGGAAGTGGGVAGGAAGSSGAQGGDAGSSSSGAGGGGGSVSPECAAVDDAFGCCQGNTVNFCNKGVLFSKDCTPGSCGWDPVKSYYSCVGVGADPSGVHPMACPGGAGGAGGSAAGGSGGDGGTAGQGSMGAGGGNACGVTFGNAITPVFGRLDGTVIEVLVPTVPACGNDDNHAIIHMTANGAVYALWVNVGTAAMPDVGFAERDGTLDNDPYSEGWHPGGTLDYVTTFGLHSTDFTQTTPDALSVTLSSMLQVGDPVSIYAVGFDTADGGHLVHYNGAGQDGAVVMSPISSPHFLLFDFTEQTF